MFRQAMRGYDMQQVDEYLAYLGLHPGAPAPAFEQRMRGYDKDEVDRYLASSQ